MRRKLNRLRKRPATDTDEERIRFILDEAPSAYATQIALIDEGIETGRFVLNSRELMWREKADFLFGGTLAGWMARFLVREEESPFGMVLNRDEIGITMAGLLSPLSKDPPEFDTFSWFLVDPYVYGDPPPDGPYLTLGAILSIADFGGGLSGATTRGPLFHVAAGPPPPPPLPGGPEEVAEMLRKLKELEKLLRGRLNPRDFRDLMRLRQYLDVLIENNPWIRDLIRRHPELERLLKEVIPKLRAQLLDRLWRLQYIQDLKQLRWAARLARLGVWALRAALLIIYIWCIGEIIRQTRIRKALDREFLEGSILDKTTALLMKCDPSLTYEEARERARQMLRQEWEEWGQDVSDVGLWKKYKNAWWRMWKTVTSWDLRYW